MSNDGSNPLSAAVSDTVQKGTALAAIAMQLVAERHRSQAVVDRRPSVHGGIAGSTGAGEGGGATARYPALPGPPSPPGLPAPTGRNHLGGAGGDYLSTQSRWAEAFQLNFAQADGRRALGVWLEAAQHAELYPSARQAMDLSGRRLKEIDSRFTELLETRSRAGFEPVMALETAAREQLQLPPGRSIDSRWQGPFEVQVRDPEGEVDTIRRPTVYGAVDEAVHIGNHIQAGDRLRVVDAGGREVAEALWPQIQAQNPYLVQKLSDGRYLDHQRAATLAGAIDGYQALTQSGIQSRVVGPDGREIDVHRGPDPLAEALRDQDHHRERGSWEAQADPDFTQANVGTERVVGDPATEGQRRAAEGLGADERHAGLVMTGAVDRPETPSNERIEGLVDSGERFQIAEVAQANAASLTALSYPHEVEVTMAAVHRAPLSGSPSKGVPRERGRGRGQIR